MKKIEIILLVATIIALLFFVINDYQKSINCDKKGGVVIRGQWRLICVDIMELE